MKTLIIAEKPDMGRNIAAAIEPKAKNMRTHLVGDQYIITWAIGHLVSLAEPDLYDEKYKKWNLSHLPIIPEQFKLVANKQTLTQLNIIKELATQADMLVNACDAGREGQYIFHLIQTYLKLKQPVKRLWISDLTPETIRKGFQELKEGEDYRPLTLAATARSEADWLIGMNGTRAFTTKHNELLSVGRVQTPVLALIYDREKQIEQFDSLVYYEVEASFSQQKTNYKGVLQVEQRLADKEKAEQIADQVNGKEGKIFSYDKKEVKEYPHKLYDLTLLQREANAKLNFSAKKTLDIAQSLYEKHKLITYPRTNSNYVNEQNIPEMHKALHALKGTSYSKWVELANANYVHKNNKAICNPAKVEDHHAILPTVKKAGQLNPDEQKLYDLIVIRFLSQFFDPAEYIAHTVLTEVEGHLFKTNLKQLVSLGWKQLVKEQEQATKKSRSKKEQDEDEEVEIDLPFELDSHLPVKCKTATSKEKQTKPPKSFTEGTLLKAMESAGKQIENEEMREAMKDSGLGTPATRASTIERLKNVGYITMQGKRITITAKGKLAIELIRGAGVDLLTSPEMTGMWEKRLNEIARGQASHTGFMDNVRKFATMIVQKVNMQRAVNKQLFQVTENKASKSTSKRTKTTKVKASTENKAKTKVVKPASNDQQLSDQSHHTTASNGNGNVQPAMQATLTTICKCPNEACTGYIIKGRKDYGCSGYKTGCRVIIRQHMFGYQMESSDILQLIQAGKTKKVPLLTPGGEEVNASIILVNKKTGECSIDI